MKLRIVTACAVFAFAVAGIAGGCSPGRDSNGPKGSLAITVGATRGQAGGAFPTAAAAAGHDDAVSHLRAAVIKIAGLEARMADGTWVPVETGLPADVDLIAIMDAGSGVTLPAGLLPEGDYDALGLRTSQVQLALTDGTKPALVPPGSGWTVRVPVSFRVVVGESTIVHLNVNCMNSFRVFDGAFEFEPEIDPERVEHD